MAAVKINGNQLSWIWSTPFCFDITDYIKNGDNLLELEVVNLWPNRLIGDSKLPPEQRLTKTNINKFNEPGSEKYLRVSGLMGPVQIISISYIELKTNQ
jgi:hypothetical protein